KASVANLSKDQVGFFIANTTPFYAESGGQTGDSGSASTATGKAQVLSCRKSGEIFLHSVLVTEGEFKSGDAIQLQVDDSERRKVMANHSATHLLHAALRKVLGTHVTQAGSLVDANKTRFDFTHNKSLSSAELLQVENLVNEQIQLAQNVDVDVLPYQQAIEKGAMALFGEKYGDEVRVLTMGSFSTELCGGTHVKNTSQIRLFKIVSEGGVSSGVRRIEALTGENAFHYLNFLAQENLKVRATVGASNDWSQWIQPEALLEAQKPSTESKEDLWPLPTWIEKSRNEIKNLQKDLKKNQGSQVSTEDLVTQAMTFKQGATEHKVVYVYLNQIEDREVLAQIVDDLKNKIQSGVVVILGGSASASHPLIVSVTKDLIKEFPAGGLLKDLAALLGGKGGGRPDFAQGAVPNQQDWDKAVGWLKTKLGI
ncbi:MAG: DHHA1 domain-containing protein, partial [Pseudobdellovibrionaceae bacterium]